MTMPSQGGRQVPPAIQVAASFSSTHRTVDSTSRRAAPAMARSSRGENTQAWPEWRMRSTALRRARSAASSGATLSTTRRGPPGRSTRAAWRSALPGSARWCRAARSTTASKVPSRKGSA